MSANRLTLKGLQARAGSPCFPGENSSVVNNFVPLYAANTLYSIFSNITLLVYLKATPKGTVPPV
jgi:hypothetical protein